MTTSTGARSRGRTAFRPRLPDAVQRDWQELVTRPEPAQRFDPASVASLPGPARRWLTHAIAPGTPLRYCVELDQHGQLKLGTWRRFEARQVLAPLDGYIWAVTAHVFGLPVHGYDRLTGGTGDMYHRLLGRLTVVASSGPDHTRSAAGRLVSEMVWVPAVGLAPEVSWHAVDDTQVTALVPYGGRTHPVTLTVLPSGALRAVTLPRWASLDKEPFREHAFTAVFRGEGTFGGYTVPTRTVAGYDLDPEGPADTAFIRQAIDAATYH